MKMKKVLALLLVFTLMLAIVPGTSVLAAEGTEKGDVLTSADGKFAYYKYTVTDETSNETDYILEIKKYLGDEKNVVISENLGEESPYTVRIIGVDAFADKSQMESVVLPDTVTTIGARAFNNCTFLTSINLTDNITAIEDSAFFNCKSIAGIHMPKAIERIGSNAFFGCESLAGNVSVKSDILNDDGTYNSIIALIFPNTLTYLGDGAFASCKSLVSVVIPESITSIFTGTFTDCASLEKIDIPYSVTYIGAAFNGAFSGHNRLCTYEPTLIIRNPHCEIILSDSMDKHTVVKGVKYSLVNHMAEEGGYTFEAIDAPAQHNFSYSGVVTNPTCYEDGYITYTCDCGEYDDFCIIYTDELKSTGHDYGDWYLGITGEGGEDDIVDPADVDTGYNKDDEGGTNIGDILDGITGSLGGSTGDGSENTEETENNEGVSTLALEDTRGALDSVLNPNPTVTAEEFEQMRKDGAYKPYCTVGAAISRKCSDCGFIQNGHKKAEGHKIYNVTTATCTEYGVIREKCVACNVSFSQKTATPTGHDYDYSNAGVRVEYVKCQTNGEELVGVCKTCGYEFIKYTYAHTDADDDGKCDDCGSPASVVNCSCTCHNTGTIWNLLNTIKLIIWKLFKVEKHCPCGVVHY